MKTWAFKFNTSPWAGRMLTRTKSPTRGVLQQYRQENMLLYKLYPITAKNDRVN